MLGDAKPRGLYTLASVDRTSRFVGVLLVAGNCTVLPKSLDSVGFTSNCYLAYDCSSPDASWTLFL